jgi:enamine deaminase RidA (YjgF/YER057c/UK114 family)
MMMTSAYQRLRDLGLELPAVLPPGGHYVPARLAGDMLYLAGQGPPRADGGWHAGKVGLDVTVDEARAHAHIVALQVLATVHAAVGDLDRVEAIKVFGMVNAVPDFTQHPEVINAFSDLLVAVLGERGHHARSAIGVGSLPNGMTVEIETIFRVVTTD